MIASAHKHTRFDPCREYWFLNFKFPFDFFSRELVRASAQQHSTPTIPLWVHRCSEPNNDKLEVSPYSLFKRNGTAKSGTQVAWHLCPTTELIFFFLALIIIIDQKSLMFEFQGECRLDEEVRSTDDWRSRFRWLEENCTYLLSVCEDLFVFELFQLVIPYSP